MLLYEATIIKLQALEPFDLELYYTCVPLLLLTLGAHLRLRTY